MPTVVATPTYSASLTPKLDALKQRATNTLQLALEKAIAHHDDPGRYPLPTDPASAERRLYGSFAALPRLRRNAIAAKILPQLRASAAERRQALGDLAQVNLRSAQPVVEQAKTIPVPTHLKFSEAEWRALEGQLPRPAARPQGYPTSAAGKPGQGYRAATPQKGARAAVPQQAQTIARRLDLRLDRVLCVADTKEVGRDEIHLAGVALDSLENRRAIDRFKVGEFREGDEVGFGAEGRVFASFDLTQGGVQFPKAFAVVLTLIEKDWGTDEELDFLFTALVAGYAILTTLVGVSLIVMNLPALLITAGAMVALISFGAFVLPFLSDDIPETVALPIVINSPAELLLDGDDVILEETARFVPSVGGSGLFDGEYEVAVKWQLLRE